MTTIGERVTRLRQEANMNRPKLAREADVSYSFLVQVETGQRKNPQADKLAKVARVLGVSLDALLSDEEGVGAPPDDEAGKLRDEIVSQMSLMSVEQLEAVALSIRQVQARSGEQSK